MTKGAHLKIGIGAIAFAVFLVLVGIPYGVNAPSNIQNIVLSPLFWPQILAGLMALAGLGLILTSFRLPASEPDADPGIGEIPGGWIRLAAMAVLMIVYVWAMPYVGMVWTSMAAFIASAFIMQTRHPLAALIAAVVLPLILYAFFAHVAGVAVPQGELVRLP